MVLLSADYFTQSSIIGSPVFLTSSSYFQFNVYTHELGHALGVIHEQSRPDREEYIHVRDVHINPKRKGAYSTIREAYFKAHGTKYDISSIMHYSARVRLKWKLLSKNEGFVPTVTE